MRKREKAIQTILFDKRYFTRKQVKSMLKEEGLSDYIDPSVNYYRVRQIDPTDFRKNSFRTHHITHGIKAVVGTLKSGR